MNVETENLIKERLRNDANLIRQRYIKKPIGKGNVALAEIHLQHNDIAFCVGATSRRNSPTPQPKAKSQGGQFEPIIDSRTFRYMDTDAEYKVFSFVGETLEMFYNLQIEGNLYLYTELQPCESCNGILRQFQDKFVNINVKVFWDYPYP